MVCEHIKKLHKYVVDNKLQVTSSDLVHIVCNKCKDNDVCVSIK